MPIKDKELEMLVHQQTEMFNRNAPVEEKAAVLSKIQKIQNKKRDKQRS